MKQVLHLCSKIRGLFSASQCSDVGYDCRLTVVRPSFDRRSSMLKLCSVLAILLTVGVGDVWGKNFFTDALNPSGSSSFSSREGWSNCTKCYAHYASAIRLGTSGSGAGSITKTTMSDIGASPTNIVVRFAAKCWGSDDAPLNITVNNAGTANINTIYLQAQTTTNDAASFAADDYYEVIIIGATSSTTITFSTNSAKRLLLSDMRISSYSPTGNYILVESAEDITAGEYLIVSGNTYALKTRNGNVSANTYGTYVNISSYYNSSSKSIASNATTDGYIYKIASSTNGHSIKRKVSTEYLGCNTGNNNAALRWDKSFTSSTDEWTLGVNSIVSYNQSARGIRWNSDRFGTYVKDTQTEVQLFKKTCKVDVRDGSTVILPAGSSTYSTGDWKDKGAPTAYAAQNDYKISGYCVTLTQAGDYNAANGLQLKASVGVITITGITSTNGVDVDVVIASGTKISIALTGASTLTNQTTGTSSISTSSTTATLTISKGADNAGYIKTITIKPREVTCADPTALTKGSFNSSTQKMPINWTSAAGEVDICYSSNSTPPGGTPGSGYTVIEGQTGSTSTSNTYNIDVSGLSAGDYYCWVRSVCDEDSKSAWTAITGNTFTVPGYTLTISPDPSASGTFDQTSGQTVVVGRTVSITATPAAGYDFTSWAVSGTGSSLSSTSANPTTFTMGTANATVTATFTAKTLSSISLDETAVTIYDQQYTQIGVTYDPSDILTKGYTLVASPTKVVTTGSTNAQLKISATKAGVTITSQQTETVSIKANADNTKTASVTVTINPLPKVHFADLVHGKEFSDVAGTISANVLVSSKTTPTSDDWDSTYKNDCEEDHVHLVGWIRSDWPDLVAYLAGTGDLPETDDITDAGNDGSGNAYYFTAGASINVLTFDGKTFYAVWAKAE